LSPQPRQSPMPPDSFSPLVVEGLIFDDPQRPPAHGWLMLDDGCIAARGSGPPGRPADIGDPTKLIVPGFIDAHMHLPQIGSTGCVAGALLPWLESVIFPAEARWTDPDAAERHLTAGVQRMLAAGTIGAAAYLTSHAHAVPLLRKVHQRFPIRLRAGQVAMDRGAPPELLAEAPSPLPADEDRLSFTITPRFAPACTPGLLAQLGRAASSGTHFVQTHLAEQIDECALVRRLFPEHPTYTEVYDHFGLLGPRTIAAHGVHLSRGEFQLLASRGTVIAHCPAANTFLGSGLFDLRAARQSGVRVALGTDVAAGADLAMPRAARAMIEVAMLRRITTDPDAYVPTPAEAWSLITRDNAAMLGFSGHGSLQEGDHADLLILKIDTPPDQYLAGRLIFGWENSMIEHRILAGRPITIA